MAAIYKTRQFRVEAKNERQARLQAEDKVQNDERILSVTKVGEDTYVVQVLREYAGKEQNYLKSNPYGDDF